MLGDITRRAEQHGRMSVVAAGVHASGVFRTMRKIVFLLQRQSVHVGTQANGTPAAAFPQGTDHAGSRQAAMHFQSIGRELAGDDVGGASFMEGQFGMGMDIPANGDQFVKKGNGQ